MSSPTSTNTGTGAPNALTRPPRLGESGALLARLQLSVVNVGYVLLAVPALVLAIVVTVSLSVSLVIVGMIALLAFVPLLGLLADVHRSLAGWLLGREIRRPYPRTRTAPPACLKDWAREPGRWRELGWAWLSVVVGWALSWVGFGLTAAIGWYALFPFLFAVTDGNLGADYGILLIDTQLEAFLEWGFLFLAVPLWWIALPALVRFRAQLDAALLAADPSELRRLEALVEPAVPTDATPGRTEMPFVPVPGRAE